MYSGVWGRRFTLLTWKKIQQVELQQSLYQRSHNMATLRFITAGGKVSLFYIKYELARQLTDRILYYVESRKEGWM
jgi:putative membrane protein